MAQRSLHTVTKVYYRSTSCFATVPDKWSPLAVLRFPPQSVPSCTMWFRRFTKNITMTDHKVWFHPHSTEHDTQSIAYLICKQAIPYQTRGGTCCPGVSTHDEKTCMTLMTTWLSITNQVWTQILSTRLRYSIKACKPMCILEKERERIGSIWSRVTCLALPLVVAQSPTCRAPGDSWSLQRLTLANENKQHKQINKQYTKQCLITKQTVPKDATCCYEHLRARII
jgi:hypothetical protein